VEDELYEQDEDDEGGGGGDDDDDGGGGGDRFLSVSSPLAATPVAPATAALLPHHIHEEEGVVQCEADARVAVSVLGAEDNAVEEKEEGKNAPARAAKGDEGEAGNERNDGMLVFGGRSKPPSLSLAV
jgi:hypothetical protein